MLFGVFLDFRDWLFSLKENQTPELAAQPPKPPQTLPPDSAPPPFRPEKSKVRTTARVRTRKAESERGSGRVRTELEQVQRKPRVRMSLLLYGVLADTFLGELVIFFPSLFDF